MKNGDDLHVLLGVIDVLLAIMITMMAYFISMSFDKYSGDFSSNFVHVENFETINTNVDGVFSSFDYQAIILKNNSIFIYDISVGHPRLITETKNIDILRNHINKNETYIIYEESESIFFDKLIRLLSSKGINFGIAQVAK